MQTLEHQRDAKNRAARTEKKKNCSWIFEPYSSVTRCRAPWHLHSGASEPWWRHKSPSWHALNKLSGLLYRVSIKPHHQTVTAAIGSVHCTNNTNKSLRGVKLRQVGLTHDCFLWYDHLEHARSSSMLTSLSRPAPLKAFQCFVMQMQRPPLSLHSLNSYFSTVSILGWLSVSVGFGNTCYVVKKNTQCLMEFHNRRKSPWLYHFPWVNLCGLGLEGMTIDLQVISRFLLANWNKLGRLTWAAQHLSILRLCGGGPCHRLAWISVSVLPAGETIFIPSRRCACARAAKSSSSPSPRQMGANAVRPAAHSCLGLSRSVGEVHKKPDRPDDITHSRSAWLTWSKSKSNDLIRIAYSSCKIRKHNLSCALGTTPLTGVTRPTPHSRALPWFH